MINNFLKKKIIITGVSGFIGAHLTKYLTKKKLDVVGFYRNSSNRLNDLGIQKNVIKIDSYSKIPYSDDSVLIHLAEHAQTNKDGNKNDAILSKLLINKNFFYYMYFSSSLVYGDQHKSTLSEKIETAPNSNYSNMKFVNENFFDLKKSVILRITNVYGNHMNKNNIFNDIIAQLSSDNLVKIRNGLPIREFLYIDDLCKLIFLILKNPIFGVYNVGSCEKISIKNLTLKIIKNFKNKNLDIVETDNTNDNSSIILNSNKIMKKINWKPEINLDEGIKKLIK